MRGIVLLLLVPVLASSQSTEPQENLSVSYCSKKEENFCIFSNVELKEDDNYELKTNESDAIDKIKFTGSVIPVLTDAICKNFPLIWNLQLLKLEIKSIRPEAFKHCPGLKIVNLTRNEITHLAPETFAKHETLEEVELEFNRLEYVSMSFFAASNDTLKKLVLSNNYLRYVFIDNSITFTKLEELKLNNNQLMDIDSSGLMNQLVNLKTVTLQKNLISCTRFRKIVDELKGKHLGGYRAEDCTNSNDEKVVPVPAGEHNKTDDPTKPLKMIADALQTSKTFMTWLLVFAIFTFLLMCALLGGGYFLSQKLIGGLENLGKLSMKSQAAA